jgi:hypothetical protein
MAAENAMDAELRQEKNFELNKQQAIFQILTNFFRFFIAGWRGLKPFKKRFAKKGPRETEINGWRGLKPFKKRFAKKGPRETEINGWRGLTVMIFGCGPMERGSTPRAGLFQKRGCF